MYHSYVVILIVAILAVCIVSSEPNTFSRTRRRDGEGGNGGNGEAADEGEFFLRSAKWVSKMNPSGGSLVSGRGGFRPGFVSRDWRHVMAEPNFVKRSGSPPYFDY